jgi:hypothetical protein
MGKLYLLARLRRTDSMVVEESGEREGATHHGGAGDVGDSDDSLDSQEAPRKLHDNKGVLGFFRNAMAGPEIGTMVALKTPHDVQK